MLVSKISLLKFAASKKVLHKHSKYATGQMSIVEMFFKVFRPGPKSLQLLFPPPNTSPRVLSSPRPGDDLDELSYYRILGVRVCAVTFRVKTYAP